MLFQFILCLFFCFCCCTKFEVPYLCRAAKLIWADPAPFVALLYGFKLCYYYTKKLATNMRYSGSYELSHTAEFCTFKILSCGLARNLPFWVPMVDFNKYIAEYKCLSLQIAYSIFITYSDTYACILTVLCFTMNHEKICTIVYGWIHNYSTRSCKALDTKERWPQPHQKWIWQNKCHRFVQIFLFVIKNLGIACRFCLWKINQS